MLALVLSVFASSAALQADTVVVLGVIERDLTGDGTPEVLRLLGTGESIDSLNVTFSIESTGDVIFQTQLRPLTRTVGFGGVRRELSASEQRARLSEFAGWFFGDGKFMRPEEFVERLRRSGPRHVTRVPEVIARDRRSQVVIDSLTAAGHSRVDAERRARYLLRVPLDTMRAAITWQEIQSTGVTVFEFSPGGDRVQAIAWSTADQRFYELLECC